jgi:hypothetical protein
MWLCACRLCLFASPLPPQPHPLPPLLKARGKKDIVDLFDTIDVLSPLLEEWGQGVRLRDRELGRNINHTK